MQYLNDANVHEFLARDSLRMLVFGTRDDLGSQVFGRQLTEFDRLTGTRLTIGIIDVAASPEITAEWGVTPESLPVQLVFEDGLMQRVMRGVRSPKAMLTELKPYLERPQV